jgi:hypothetical protein
MPGRFSSRHPLKCEPRGAVRRLSDRRLSCWTYCDGVCDGAQGRWRRRGSTLRRWATRSRRTSTSQTPSLTWSSAARHRRCDNLVDMLIYAVRRCRHDCCHILLQLPPAERHAPSAPCVIVRKVLLNRQDCKVLQVDKLVAGFAGSPVAAADAELLARLTLDGAMREAQG